MHLLHSIMDYLFSHLPYAYEVMGGFLIFYSSAVTETKLPEPERRKHWIIFGGMAVIYILVGIGIRRAELQRGEIDKQYAAEDRNALRDIRNTMDTRMDGVFSSFQATYLQLASLSLDLHNMRVGLTQAINRNDPHKLADLEKQAQTAQQQVDNLSHEVLAITMAPRVAQQLRDWDGERRGKQSDLHNFEWEAVSHFRDQHRGDNEGLRRIEASWDHEYEKADNEYRERLKGIIATADFVRKEMLQQIPLQQQYAEDKKQEQEFAQANNNPESLDRNSAAQYLENLARRVPPPK